MVFEHIEPQKRVHFGVQGQKGANHNSSDSPNKWLIVERTYDPLEWANLYLLGTFFNVIFCAWLIEMVFEHIGAHLDAHFWPPRKYPIFCFLSHFCQTIFCQKNCKVFRKIFFFSKIVFRCLAMTVYSELYNHFINSQKKAHIFLLRLRNITGDFFSL